MLRKFRRLNQFWAWLRGYFWLPCPICGEMFGGHEISDAGVFRWNIGKAVCWKHGEDFKNRDENYA